MKENSINLNKEILNKKDYELFHKNLEDYNDHIDLNLFDYFCSSRNSKKYKLFSLGNSFFRKRMDIVHVFTIISVLEKILLNNNYQKFLALYEEIE